MPYAYFITSERIPLEIEDEVYDELYDYLDLYDSGGRLAISRPLRPG